MFRLNHYFPIFAFLISALIVRVAIAIDPPIHPAQIAEWVDEAKKLEADGSTESAIWMYQRAVRLNPENPSLLSGIGKLRLRSGDFEAAAENLSQAALLEPDRASHHNDAGIAFAKAKKYPEAIEHLVRAVKLDPANLRYANNLATAYVDAGEDDKAVAALESAPHRPASVHFNMAYLYNKRERYDEARIEVEAALLHDPKLSRAIRLRNKLARR